MKKLLIILLSLGCLGLLGYEDIDIIQRETILCANKIYHVNDLFLADGKDTYMVLDTYDLCIDQLGKINVELKIEKKRENIL